MEMVLGLDEETGMPYAGASVSYDFYDYVLKLKNGEVTLNGNLTVGNVFSPFIDGVLCKTLVEADKATNYVTNHKIEVATAFLGAGALLETKLIYGAAAGILVSSPVVEASLDKNPKLRSLPAFADDEKISVTFIAHPYQGNNSWGRPLLYFQRIDLMDNRSLSGPSIALGTQKEGKRSLHF